MNRIVDTINRVFTAAADLLLWPFSGLERVWGLVAVSVLSGIVLLLIYGKISNQDGIRAIKKKIGAALLEAVLYRHDLQVCLKAQGRMLWYAVVYFALAVPPIVILMVPCLIVLAQLNLRYESAGLAQGEAAVLKVKVDNVNYLDSITLAAGEEIESTPRLRIAESGEVLWRIAPRQQGAVAVRVESSGEEFRQTVAVIDQRAAKLPAVRVKQWWWGILYPGESLLPSTSPISEISLRYPGTRYELLGLQWHWLVLFLVVSILSGLAASKVFGIAV